MRGPSPSRSRESEPPKFLPSLSPRRRGGRGTIRRTVEGHPPPEAMLQPTLVIARRQSRQSNPEPHSTTASPLPQAGGAGGGHPTTHNPQCWSAPTSSAPSPRPSCACTCSPAKAGASVGLGRPNEAQRPRHKRPDPHLPELRAGDRNRRLLALAEAGAQGRNRRRLAAGTLNTGKKKGNARAIALALPFSRSRQDAVPAQAGEFGDLVKCHRNQP